MQGSKTPKNFFIRPTVGIGSRGFSLDKKELLQKKESKFAYSLNNNNNNNNVLIQVNSYGFRPSSQSSKEDAEHLQQLRTNSRGGGGGMRQTFFNNVGSEEDRSVAKQKQIGGNNYNSLSNLNQGSSIHRIHTPGQYIPIKYTPNIQLHQQYRIIKHKSQDLQREDPVALESMIKKSLSTYNELEILKSYSSSKVHLPHQIAERRSLKKSDAAFELEISDIKPKQSQFDEKQKEIEEEEDDDDNKDDDQEDQLSVKSQVIRVKEIANFEDSFNQDIQDLEMSGFNLVKKQRKQEEEKKDLLFYSKNKEDFQNGNLFDDCKQKQTKSSNLKQSPEQFIHDKLPTYKLDQEIDLEQQNCDFKKGDNIKYKEKRLSSFQFNMASDKQFDETFSSQQFQKTGITSVSNNNQAYNSHNNTNTNTDYVSISQHRNNTASSKSNHNTYNNITKENNQFNLINLKQGTTSSIHETRFSRPQTNQFMNRQGIASTKQYDLQQNAGGVQINFYDLFAGQSQGALKNSRGALFHNFYKNEQLKSLANSINTPSTTFSVKKAQLFSMPARQQNPMSRQGQRMNKNTNSNNNSNKEYVQSNSLESHNAMASKIQQQLILGIAGSKQR